jgi:hypothetical protein
MGAHGVEIPAHLVADAEVPILAGLQLQGDVAIVPQRPGRGVFELVPPEGVAVVRGEAGGNTHLLVGETIGWRAASEPAGSLLLGVVRVPAGTAAYMLHPQHGAMGLAGGHDYRVGRQRELADEIRRVAD